MLGRAGPCADCLAAVAACALAALVTGCSSGSPGAQLSMRPPRSQPISRLAGKTLELPKDGAFLIALAPCQRAPGLDGKADANAQAAPDGSGDVSARVENGGTASGTVQIGHALQNDSAQQVDLEVSVGVDLKFNVQADADSRSPEASVAATLFARDERNRELATVALAGHSSDKGSASSADHKDVTLTVPLGPGQTAYVYVAGDVAVTTQAGRTAAGRLEIRSMQMRFDVRPAPPVKSASDEPR